MNFKIGLESHEFSNYGGGFMDGRRTNRQTNRWTDGRSRLQCI